MFDLGSKNQDLPPWTPNAGGLQGAEPGCAGHRTILRLRTLPLAPQHHSALGPGQGGLVVPSSRQPLDACLPSLPQNKRKSTMLPPKML